MLTLILTEKPSVARDFAKALQVDSKGRKNGFLEGNNFIVTWAVGHLVELAEPQDYDPKWAKWDLSTLPILPHRLKYKPIAQTEGQLRIVQKQLQRKDIGQIVIATDAGREGEVIARTILDSVHAELPSRLRFWTSQALTPQVILDTMEHLRPSSEFDRLWHAGQARQIADWLVGMNLSRAATLKLGNSRDVFSVGRVQTAVLALLVDRRRERENFKPEPYWLLRAGFANTRGEWWGLWFKGEQNRFEKLEDANQVVASIAEGMGKVKSVKREKKRQPPPMLYSLTDLQREANTRFGFSAKLTLDTAQKLYEEKKCLSYPRTDSKVLGSKNVGLVKNILQKLSTAYPETFQGIEDSRIGLSNKRVFNDAKLTDHHALIPLTPFPEGSGGQTERRIYELVLKRFAAAFHPDYEYEATEIITEVCGETFRTKGSRPLKLGWKAVYGLKEYSAGTGEEEPEEENLPLLEKNDPAKVAETRVEEKMTQPPPEYSEALLLKDMTNPSRFVSEEELQRIFKGEPGLGTQATRAQIIETLISRKYVLREKKKLAATDKGCFLIDHLRKLEGVKTITSPEETARWEFELERIARGMGDRDLFLSGIASFVERGVKEFKAAGRRDLVRHTFGKCPACGGEIIEGRRGYGCKNWREENGGCRFVVWKDIAGRRIGPELLAIILSGTETPVMQFRSKDGKEFKAALKLEKSEEEGRWETRFIYSDPLPAHSGGDSGGEAEKVGSLGKCPRCGGKIVEGKIGFGCSNWREENGGCKFVIWKTIAGKKISLQNLRQLLEEGETDTIKGFTSRNGKKFSAKLKLDEASYKTTLVY